MGTSYEQKNLDPSADAKWMAKHGFEKDADGKFPVDSFKSKDPVTVDELLENIKKNAAGGHEALEFQPYDHRIFTMICGGPSLANHLNEIRRRANEPDKYLVVCSNMTGAYLLKHGIVPHVHFIVDPKEKKWRDVYHAVPDTKVYASDADHYYETMTNFIMGEHKDKPANPIENGFHPDVEYWINAGCNPKVFETLVSQGAKPKIFLAEYEGEGVGQKAMFNGMVQDPNFKGFIGIQGGTMAGLRAMNLADARGHREMHYFGFDSTVEVSEYGARAYAYKKARGEAIIEVSCDRCGEKFPTTLILQGQVNEFLKWHSFMPWLKVEIIGGGLVSHYYNHVRSDIKPKVTYRFTAEYMKLQREMHETEKYGVSGIQNLPTIFHGISQLAKKHGAVSVLDYGSADGKTFMKLQEEFWLPPSVDLRLYEPALEGLNAEPEPADFVVCTDVLEHVEPECTWAVLDHLQALTKKLIFVSISMKPAGKSLSDGRNAHINLRDAEFWLKEFKKRFIVSEGAVNEAKSEVLIVAQSIKAVEQTLRESYAGQNQEDQGRVQSEHAARNEGEKDQPAQGEEARAAA